MKVLGGLQRLAGLYGMLEQMRLLQVRLAAGAVEDVECAAAMEAKLHGESIDGARSALSRGDREALLLAETSRRLAEIRMQRLRTARAERASALEAAMEEHRESRLQHEQIDCVVQVQRRQKQEDLERREQSESDDRFAARLSWSGLAEEQDAP